MIGLAVALAVQAPQLVRVTAIALGEGERASSALRCDLDGGGGDDLLIAVRTVDGAHELRAHLCSNEGPSDSPAWVRGLPADVVAYAVGELDPRAGREVLLLSGRGAFRFSPDAPEGEQFAWLGEAESLWQAPFDSGPVPWPEGVHDADDDGDDDVLVPEPDGYRLLRQERDGDGVRWVGERLELSGASFVREVEGAFELVERIRPEATRNGERVLVDVSESTPAPFWIDEDGDGRTDLAVQDGDLRVTWFGADAGFRRSERKLPLAVDLERQLDISFSSHLADIDGRPGAESVLVARERKDGEDRTQVLVYGADFERPRQVLVLQGLVAASELVDLDGDGALDLVTLGFGDDFLDQLRSARSDEIELRLNVFANRDGSFTRTPVLIERLRFVNDGAPVLELAADATGDRGLELLLRKDAGTLAMVTLIARGDQWRLMLDKPIWTRGASPSARLIRVAGDDRRSWFLAEEPGQVFLFEVGP
jgi:hypothetical protein